MKVNIGKYPRRLMSTLHTDYMRKKYEYDWPDQESRFERFVEKVEDTLQSCYNVLNWAYFDRQEQKINVRIDRQDTWSMDCTLANIIVPMLKQLKQTKQGSTMVDDDDVLHLPSQGTARNESMQRDMFSNEEHDELVWNQYDARWSWVMEEMIWAFEQKLVDWDEQYYEYARDPNSEFGLKLVWEDRAGRQAHYERMQNGFRLFGKYYEGLWS